MACGKPVVAHDIPGVRSVVDDTTTGFLVEPGDADDLAARIETLLGDRKRAADMGAQGRAKVDEKYAWSRVVPLLEKIYMDVLFSSFDTENEVTKSGEVQ